MPMGAQILIVESIRLIEARGFLVHDATGAV